MDEVMISWRDRGKGGNALDGVGVGNSAEGEVSLPLGPGEWDEPLGLPVCVVCQNVSILPRGKQAISLMKPSLTKLKSWNENGPGKRTSLIRSYSTCGRSC